MSSKKKCQDNKHCLQEMADTVPSPTCSSSVSRVQFSYSENSWTFILFYHTVLWSGEIYSLYNFYLLSQRWKKTLDITEKQNFFGGTYQDQNDLEWKIFASCLLEYAPYGIMHLIVAQFIRCFCPWLLKMFYITFSSIMAVKIVGLWGMALCYLIPVVMTLVLLSRLKIFVWLTWCLLLALFNFRYFEEFLVNKPFEFWDLYKMLWFVGQCARFLFWFWLADFLLYFFYAHALIFVPNYISGFDSWTMAGYYSFLLIFFILKYVVFYGLPSILARAEGFEPPDPPRCVIFIEKFSHIWKYFDIGLHRFMIDHIYIPFLGEDATFFRQVQGYVVAFTFVYVWHGAYPSVFWWCAINFTLTIIEKVADKLVETSIYKNWEDTWLPGRRKLIFHRIVAGIFFSLATNSIIIFLTSTEHAEKVFSNIYIKGFPLTTVTTVLFFAFLSQGSMDLRNYRRRGKLKSS